LYVSDGLSRKPGEALFYAWENKFIDFARQLGVSNIAFEASELDATPLFERFVDHSNANQVTRPGPRRVRPSIPRSVDSIPARCRPQGEVALGPQH